MKIKNILAVCIFFCVNAAQADIKITVQWDGDRTIQAINSWTDGNSTLSYLSQLIKFTSTAWIVETLNAGASHTNATLQYGIYNIYGLINVCTIYIEETRDEISSQKTWVQNWPNTPYPCKVTNGTTDFPVLTFS